MRLGRVRAGFTLVELLVAITIGAMAVLTARALLEGLGESAERIRAHASASDFEGNAERALRELALRVEVGTDYAIPFAGGERSARFTSWCAVPHGWLERCTVTLVLDVEATDPFFAAALSTGELLVLRRSFGSGEFLYLADPALGGNWLHVWGESISAPVAIGVVLDADTLIVRIGERG